MKGATEGLCVREECFHLRRKLRDIMFNTTDFCKKPYTLPPGRDTDLTIKQEKTWQEFESVVEQKFHCPITSTLVVVYI